MDIGEAGAGAALALSSSVFGGTADFLGGTTSRIVGTVRFMFCTQAAGLLLAGSWVAISREPLPDLATLGEALAAGVSLIISLTAFFQAMVVGTVSIVAPISAIGVCVPVAAGVAQGDRLGPAQVLGILAALAGMLLVARQERQHGSLPVRSSLGLALVAAFGGGVCLWLIAEASRGGVAWTLLVVRAVMALVLTVALCSRRISLRRAFERRIAWRVLASVLFGFLGFTLYALATLHGQLAVVSVLASLYPVVTVLLAYHLLGERLHRPQQVGIAAVLLGVVLLSS
ncbi:MAG TPA: EamA family transporter [Solirubrobacteraceae bacterium]|jgi:drug/metabolite transporter (DMT)-like permease|nr:EamA family transporter [Solirubrobacteraceae bacterium]